VTVVSDTLSWGVGVIVRLVGYYGRDVDELASPLIQVLPEVVQDIVGFTNFKLGGEGRSVGSPDICVDDVVAATAGFPMPLSVRS